MKRILSMLLVVMMVLSTVSFALPSAVNFMDTAVEKTEEAQEDIEPAFDDEKAELSSAVYYIYTAQDMYNVRYDLGGTYYLMNDIDLSIYSNWSPIGTYNSSRSYTFTGTFDGQGYEISGIHVDTDEEYQGLFGYVCYGTIKNVGVIDSCIKGKNSVGGVVGGVESGTVENCHNTGDVTGNGEVGGVVGEHKYSKVENCYNTGNVTGNGNVGGVVGDISGGYVSVVENCYNTGDVTGNGYVGGVVGDIYFGTVENCYNTGVVTGSSYVGGVVGENNYGTVENCYNTGAVTGSDSRVGGVVGKNSSTMANCYYLKGCATDGDGVVQFGIGNSTQGSTTADASGQTTALSGSQMKQQSSFTGFDFDTVWAIDSTTNNGYPYLQTDPVADDDNDTEGVYEIYTAEDMYNVRYDLSGTYLLMNDIDLSGYENWEPIGGLFNPFEGIFDGQSFKIIGIHIDSDESHQGLFGCVYEGTIKNVGIVDSHIKGVQCIGGVVGNIAYGTVSNCYNTGEVVSSSADGAVALYVGGVVGRSEYNSTVENCYNLTFVGFEDTEDIVSRALLSAFDKNTMSIILGFDNEVCLDDDICTLVFEVNEAADEGEYEINATPIVKLGSIVYSANLDTGIITVIHRLKGDINNDSLVDIQDAILLFQHSMMPHTYLIDYPYSLDLNKDGEINIRDAILLFQHSMMPELYPID